MLTYWQVRQDAVIFLNIKLDVNAFINPCFYQVSNSGPQISGPDMNKKNKCAWRRP